MAGLFGFFKRNNNNSNNTGDAYYLSPDDAKTYGDIDYMRKSKTIKRTFAKTVSGGGGELIKQVSAEKAQKKNPNMNFNQGSTFNSSSTLNNNSDSSSTSSFTPNLRAKTDTGMDMFRKMAKDIKKK